MNQRVAPPNRLAAHLLISVAIVVLCFVTPQVRSAESLNGKVTAATTDSAMIAVEGNLQPKVGDKVAIFFKIPGTNDEISVASGMVAAIKPKVVQVKIEKAAGKVETGQLVRIRSANPQAISPGATAKGEPRIAVINILNVFSNHPKAKQAQERIKEMRASKTPDKQVQQEALNQRNAIVREIMPALQQIMHAGGWTVVFDSSAPSAEQVPFVLYSRGITDLTDVTSKGLTSPSATQQSIGSNAIPTASLRIALVDIHKVYVGNQKTKQLPAASNAKVQAAIVDEIIRLVRQRGDRDGWNMVINSSGHSSKGGPFVVYANGVPDLSDEIISGLNNTQAFKSNFSSGNLKLAKIDLKRLFGAFPQEKQGLSPDGKVLPGNALLDHIQKTIADYARKNGYNLVFSGSAESLNGPQVLLTSDGLPDLSDQILAALRSSSK